MINNLTCMRNDIQMFESEHATLADIIFNSRWNYSLNPDLEGMNFVLCLVNRCAFDKLAHCPSHYQERSNQCQIEEPDRPTPET